MNYKYAKLLEDGTLSYAPKILKYKGRTYINPLEKHYNLAGYYLIVYTDYPIDGLDYQVEYKLIDGKIMQLWALIENLGDTDEEPVEEV